MLKRKPKVLTPEQVEEIRTKDFFDMILPGTIKFLSDHYIVGDQKPEGRSVGRGRLESGEYHILRLLLKPDNSHEYLL